MIRKAEPVLEKKLDDEKRLQEKATHDMHDIRRRLSELEDYDYASKGIKRGKIFIAFIIAILLAETGGILYVATTTGIPFIIGLGATVTVDGWIVKESKRVITNFIDGIQTRKVLSQNLEEINETRENLESMKERCKKIESEIRNREELISEYEKAIEEISTREELISEYEKAIKEFLTEEFQKKIQSNQLFYQADMKEEDCLLKREQAKEISPFEAFLNEPVNYGNIHLEVSAVEDNQRVFIKKK